MKLEDVQNQREAFAKGAEGYTSRYSSDHNAYGGFIYEDGTTHVVGRYACHGFLGTYSMETLRKKAKISYLMSAVMHPHSNVSKEDLHHFIDWLVNRSPWHMIFADKDVERIIKLGHLVDANHPTTFIASGMIASRFPTESYSGTEIVGRFAVYKELLQMKVSENEAFFYAHMFAPNAYNRLYPITFSRFSSGHSTFFAHNYQENYVRNFLEGKVVHVGKNVLAKGRGYESGYLNKTWGDKTDKDSFGEAIKRLRPIRANVKVDHHIFRKAPAVGYSYADRDDFASIIEQLRGKINA